MGSQNSHEREPRVASASHQPDVERSFSQDPKHIQDLTRLIAAETNRDHELATDNYDYRKVCYVQLITALCKVNNHEQAYITVT